MLIDIYCVSNNGGLFLRVLLSVIIDMLCFAYFSILALKAIECEIVLLGRY